MGIFLCTQSCSGRGLVTEGCWGKQTTSLLVSSGQGEGERKRGGSGHRGYLAASPQVGGYVAVDYGYDAEVYPQTHLGELGGQKGHLLPTRLAPVCKAGVSNSALESFPANKSSQADHRILNVVWRCAVLTYSILTHWGVVRLAIH